ncbi:MAG TPA: hypothetical protein VMT93_08710 [Gemmatimonadaceae bacterium]|nr:hypothetical protein [Gemmatimonadaceae bacterium]
MGCVVCVDAALVGAWTLVVPPRALAAVFFPALALAGAIHFAAAARLAALFGRRGMMRARRGAIFAILTTLVFCGVFLLVGLLMTFA